jgi:hypothetical protein
LLSKIADPLDDESVGGSRDPEATLVVGTMTAIALCRLPGYAA